MRARSSSAVALARQSAQQQKAAAEAQFVAEPAHEAAERRKRKGPRRDVREVHFAECAQMRQRRVDLVDFGAREHVHALFAVIDPRAQPGSRTCDRRQRVNHRPASFR